MEKTTSKLLKAAAAMVALFGGFSVVHADTEKPAEAQSGNALIQRVEQAREKMGVVTKGGTPAPEKVQGWLNGWFNIPDPWGNWSNWNNWLNWGNFRSW